MTTNGTQRMHCKMIDFSALRVAGRNRELMEDSCGAIVVPLTFRPGDSRAPSCIEAPSGQEDPGEDGDGS